MSLRNIEPYFPYEPPLTREQEVEMRVKLAEQDGRIHLSPAQHEALYPPASSERQPFDDTLGWFTGCEERAAATGTDK